MMTTQAVNATPKINGSQSDMNPSKVLTDTKRNPETDFNDTLSRKLYPRE